MVEELMTPVEEPKSKFFGHFTPNSSSREKLSKLEVLLNLSSDQNYLPDVTWQKGVLINFPMFDS